MVMVSNPIRIVKTNTIFALKEIQGPLGPMDVSSNRHHSALKGVRFTFQRLCALVRSDKNRAIKMLRGLVNRSSSQLLLSLKDLLVLEKSG